MLLNKNTLMHAAQVLFCFMNQEALFYAAVLPVGGQEGQRPQPRPYFPVLWCVAYFWCTIKGHNWGTQRVKAASKRVVGTKETRERQEGFPLRHFFHPVTEMVVLFNSRLHCFTQTKLARLTDPPSACLNTNGHQLLNLVKFRGSKVKRFSNTWNSTSVSTGNAACDCAPTDPSVIRDFTNKLCPA